MRPIRPKPLIPTLIVIYSTSYLLVNKRLAVKLQKPYAASSGIVSIIATNQSCGQQSYDKSALRFPFGF
ncbi:hypothetical protein D8M09_14430 [Enterobacter sp. R1(2018)]|nr:hypothetical protein D8M09_14430 [Enterobacter sp. R1(2018)]